MKYCSALLGLLLAFSALSAQKAIAYLPYYRGFDPDFDYALYTHIHYFSIWPGADGSFIYPGSMDSLSMATDFHRVADAAQPFGVEMVMTFGGTAASGSANFLEMAGDDAARAVFIQNVSRLCDTWSIDGIDIDWEWHAPADTLVSNQAYRDLMQDVRELTNERGISFSIDISPSSWNGKYSPADAVNLADYLNVMSYSYNGAWSAKTGHHAPISKGVSIGLDYWYTRGIPLSKLNLGVAFYGFAYSGTYQDGAAFSSASSILYRDVEVLLDAGYTVVADSAKGSYCYSEADNRIVYYESPDNVADKMRYAMDNGLSGVLIWELGGDTDDQVLSLKIDSIRDPDLSGQELSQGQHTGFYPNPTRDRIRLSYTRDFRVYDLQGRLLLEGRGRELQLARFPAGVYMLSSGGEQGLVVKN